MTASAYSEACLRVSRWAALSLEFASLGLDPDPTVASSLLSGPSFQALGNLRTSHDLTISLYTFFSVWQGTPWLVIP